ncbi:MAG TPA: TonB-dependent receptor [Pyrinomonadaceae bacterium]|nr:TonB-dependent receptor [Pyrinomonadaceae bacterium]
MSKFVKLSFVFAFILGLNAIAFGQSTTTGAIGGTVVNPNKEIVPGATVTVKNEGTGKEDTAVADEDGRFKVNGLQPGTYSITVNSTGFSPFTQGVVVEIGRETTVNAALSVGPLQGEQVTVTADAPVINTSQQDFSSNFNQTSINELPINGRRWSNFALLSPGAVPDGTFGLISFRGISGLLNNNTIDGGDNNQAFFAEERGRTRISYSVSQSAIKEFQVNTSSYSAEYGRSAGGVVNAVTKSGTNEFHGDAFYYQRNNKWGARNPLATKTENVGGVFTPVGFKPVDVRHQFGGTIGGPIKREKAFFFFSYDEQRRNFPGLSIFSSPTFLNLTAANRTALTARGLSTTQIDNALTFLQGLSGDLPRTGNQRLLLPKVDINLNSKNTFTATYNRLRWSSPSGIQTQATNTRARDNFGDDFVNIDWLTLRLSSTVSNSLINEFRFQWGRDNEIQFSQPPLPGEPTNAVGGRSPQTFIQNGFTFGMPEFLERPSFPDERRVQLADTATLTNGNHTFKFGGDINFVKDIISNLRFSGGEFNYSGANGISDFIVDYTNFTTNGAIRALVPGAPGSATANNGVCISTTRRAGKCYTGNFNQGFGVLGLTMKTTDLDYFLQDDWRISPRLTLNLGIRYEYQRNPEPVSANPLIPQTGISVNDKNNFGPRIGFAYDVNGDGKTSIRGGWGIYYGRVINSTVYNTLVNTGVGTDRGQRQFSISGTNLGSNCTGFTADTCAFLPIYPNLIPASNPPVGEVQFFSPNFQLPQIHQWDFIVEREIARNTVVSASYLGSFANSLPNFVDTNLNAPQAVVSVPVVGGPFNGISYRTPIFLGARPITAFSRLTEIRSDVFSKYHALVLQANRRLTDGLQFQSSYTLSRAYDNGQTSATFTLGNAPFNAFDQASENGLSAFDRRQKFVTSVVYTTNFKGGSHASRSVLNNWTFAPIFNAFSGARYTSNISGSITPGAYGFTGTACNGVGAGTCGTPGGGANGSGGATRFAQLPRNFFKQPKIWYLDMRISRRFNLGENMKLELLAEGFNLFNRTQVTGVGTTIYNFSTTGCPAGSAQCLVFNLPPNTVTGNYQRTTAADSTLFRERQVQLAARFQF